MPVAVGKRFGPYEIRGAIGAGGMGEVYRAHDTRLRRDVALKILRSSVARTPERLRRFEQEARAASALNHPNIIAIYDIGSQDDCAYIISELLEGETLGDRLRAGAISIDKAIEYAVQIAAGLAAAHDKGIIHRDLKPANIFLPRNGSVKILDFGLAKFAVVSGCDTQGARTLTLDTPQERILGTPNYMSPEQIRSDAIDYRSDIFSFGAVLYEMLTARRAFQRSSTAETMNAILHEDPPSILESASELPPALDCLVRHCLEKKPADRFQSVRDLGFSLTAMSGSWWRFAPKQIPPVHSRRGFLIAAGVAIPGAAAAVVVGRTMSHREPLSSNGLHSGAALFTQPASLRMAGPYYMRRPGRVCPRKSIRCGPKVRNPPPSASRAHRCLEFRQRGNSPSLPDITM